MNLSKAKLDLYEFNHGDSSWHFTSAKRTVTHNDVEYLPIVASRTNIDDEDIDKATIDIEFAFPLEEITDFQSIFANKIYFDGVTVTVIELYKEQSLVIFKGRVTQPQFDTKAHTMTLTCSTAETQQRRNILTRKYQRMCPNKIYDKYCGLNIDAWAIEVEITAISNKTVKFLHDEEFEDDYFSRGVIIKNGIYVLINNNQEDTLWLYRPFLQLEVGDVVKIAPGCNQTHKMCHEKFDNTFNFAGFPFMPNENPVYKEIIK